MSMATSSNVTTDHKQIRRWAEERKARPASVENTGGKGDPGLLRLDFAPWDERLHEISWEDFFDKFEEANLAFLHQDKTAEGKVSRFHKFVSRENANSKKH
jgi:hypothetical protein